MTTKPLNPTMCHTDGCGTDATVTYIWPGVPAPVFSCAHHAQAAVRIGQAMGMLVVPMPIPAQAESKPDVLDPEYIRAELTRPLGMQEVARGPILRRAIVEAIAAEFVEYRRRFGVSNELTPPRASECIRLVLRIGRACAALVEKP